MSIQNLDKLYMKLDKLSDVDLSRAAGSGISIVQAAAKYLCPAQSGELRNSIYTNVKKKQDKVIAECYTNKKYAPYVEFGTGPRGQADHEGISPNVTVAYSQRAWWIHESQIDEATVEQYGWFYIDTDEGRFYQCSGQAAQPFMYPAMHDNKEAVIEEISKYTEEAIRRTGK